MNLDFKSVKLIFQLDGIIVSIQQATGNAMNSKTILGILLSLSMIFVLYPSVTSLIDIQKLIGELGIVSSELVKTRDNLILQIIGFIFLYLVLAFGFNFIKIEQKDTFRRPQEDGPTKPQEVIETKTQRTLKPLTSRTKNVIAVFSTSVFMLVFVWQVFGNISMITTTSIDSTMFIMEQAMKATIASISVGIIAYIVAKYH